MAEGNFAIQNDVKTQVSSKDFPDWYAQYRADLANAAGSQAMQDYVPYSQQRIAGWTPDQLQAFAMQREAAIDPTWQQYVPLAGQAMQGGVDLIGQAGGLGQLASQGRTPFSQQEYEAMYGGVYEPSVQKMQAEASRIGQKDFRDTTLADLNRNFTGAGQFGSSRDQILSAEAAARAQAEIEGKQAAIEAQGRQQAAQDYLNWSKQGLATAGQLGQTGGQALGAGQNWFNFGTQQQAAQATDIASLGGIGAAQQGMDQRAMDMAYQDFQRQQEYPWQQLSRWGAAGLGQSIPYQEYSSGTGAGSTISYGNPSTTTAPYSNPWTSALQGGIGAASSVWNMFSPQK